ncbi:uncharacterized protein [Rutidosis leptorrhynchoides]|uniref:uncharacterized protein n=1 Tax=Rutidosis leptorrhynchoides TaxID=125765 RepID=UPI003A9A4D2F
MGGVLQIKASSDVGFVIVKNVLDANEKKEVISLSAMGVINVVRTVWLEDCEREKKEIPVTRRHVAYDLLLPKDSISSSKGCVVPIQKQGNPLTIHPPYLRYMLLSNHSLELEV